MIELITGLPGNAKTLMGLRRVIDRAAAEKRAVYYSGIKKLSLDDPRLKGTTWTEIEADKWIDCPPGSLIFLDEAQKTFRSRSLGVIPPKHVTELEEHRHRGIDFVMITQHPSLIDPAVRKLTQTHMHLVRIWGMEASTVHRWDSVRDNCDKPSSRKDSEKSRWAFDKSLYGVYHSADVHTFKRKLPTRLKLLMAVPVLLGAAAYTVYYKVHRIGAPAPGAVSPVVATAPAGKIPQHGFVPGQVLPAAAPVQLPLALTDPVTDARSYLAMQTPRVTGLPQSAPRYDALTAPVRVPVPAMCVQIGSVRSESGHVDCKCFTQQGTPMGVPFNMCLEFARNGYFQDFDADKDRQQVARSEASVGVLSSKPDAPAPGREAGASVVSFATPPDDVPRPVGRPSPSPGANDGPPNNKATRAAGASGA